MLLRPLALKGEHLLPSQLITDSDNLVELPEFDPLRCVVSIGFCPDLPPWKKKTENNLYKLSHVLFHVSVGVQLCSNITFVLCVAHTAAQD